MSETPAETTAPATDATEVIEETEADGTEPAAEDGDQADTTPEPQSKREAKYRVQLREAEAQRDALAATVEAMQLLRGRERIAGATIQKPSALWAAGCPLADLLNDDGTVDARKVTAAASAAQQSLGLAATRPGGFVPREGTSIRQSTRPNTWEAAFGQQ